MNVVYASVHSSVLSPALFASLQTFAFTDEIWSQLDHVFIYQHTNLEFSSSGLWA